MSNFKLLKKYKIKLSFFFALFVMLSFYFIQATFVGINYISKNIELNKTLENKLTGVINILENKEEYYSQIESADKTLQKIILKTLENSTIYKNGTIITSFIEKLPKNKDKIGVFDEGNSKFLIKNITISNDNYKIIISINNDYILLNYIKYISFFSLFLFPFFIFFYFIGHFFVGRNFRVIEQSINSLEDFTANVNHEMKTPLSEIISTLSLAKKLKNYEEANDISLNSAEKLNKILDSIVGIANLSDISYTKEKIDVVKELNLIINEFNPNLDEKKIILEKIIKNKSFILKINKEHFYLCVKNILSNAIKYSKTGGKIEISFNNGILEIKDYGIGIRKNNIQDIFNRYFRENYNSAEGFGLGLALVKKITDINNWKLNIESRKNAFTKININFL
ncbi:MAG: HAMP domain-containing sensor histidine kinase [Candidatus Gracilibacteria bacterium]